VAFSGWVNGQTPRAKSLYRASNDGEDSEGTIPLGSHGDVLRLVPPARNLGRPLQDKPPRRHESPRGTLNEDAMSTQPWPVTPASTHIESYVDCERAAEFLSVDRKTVQRLSREGRIPAHPVLTGARKGRTTWRYKLSELDEWARTQQHSVPATRATSRREK